jgi:hypothetical protein
LAKHLFNDFAYCFGLCISIFFDDSPSVLKSAKQYGIGTVVAISKPSSKVNAKEIEGFINIETLMILRTALGYVWN